eukprot:4645744-Heterocapsa_arctica.AAC.1
MKSGLEADTLPAVLIGYLKMMGYGFAFPSRVKGRSDQAAIAALLNWLQEAGLTGPLRLRSDSEAAIGA